MRPLVTLFAVLFAVFAMHGITGHERPHGCTVGTASPVVGLGGLADHGHPGSAAAPVDDSHGEPSPHQDHGLESGVCLTLLSLLAGLLTLLLRRGCQARPLCVLRRVGVGLLPRSRPADPPCLHRLSIMRC